MSVCIACSSPLRDGARFCTRCGTAVSPTAVTDGASDAPASVLEVAEAPHPPALPAQELLPVTAPAIPPEAAPIEVPARIPTAATPARPPLSRAAVWALVTGLAPLLVSVIGNALSITLGVQAVDAINAGQPEGAWAPLLTTLTIVFVGNAALLVLCAVLGGRALRETAHGAQRGRPLAVAGLAAGAVNLILWVSGLALTITSYSAILS